MVWEIMLMYLRPGSVFDGHPALRVSQKLKCQFHHKSHLEKGPKMTTEKKENY